MGCWVCILDFLWSIPKPLWQKWSTASHCLVANGRGGRSALPLFHWHPPRESGASSAHIVLLPLSGGVNSAPCSICWSHLLGEWEHHLLLSGKRWKVSSPSLQLFPNHSAEELECRLSHPWIRRIEWKNHSLAVLLKSCWGEGVGFFSVFGWSKTDIANKVFYYKVTLFSHGLARKNRLFLGLLLFSWVWGFSSLSYDRK